jgi:sortase A
MQHLNKFPVLIAALAMCLIVHSAWMPLKAWLAHQLITHSWQQNITHDELAKPWPWADTTPVIKMSVQRLNKELIALQGVDPTSLAFSAGVMHQYNSLTNNRPVVIAGHRDTHFNFLQDIQMKDIISLADTNGVNQLYQVESMEIVDSNDSEMLLDEQSSSLMLITCYPFNSLQSGGSLRYVITAKLLINDINHL